MKIINGKYYLAKFKGIPGVSAWEEYRPCQITSQYPHSDTLKGLLKVSPKEPLDIFSKGYLSNQDLSIDNFKFLKEISETHAENEIFPID